MAPNPQGYRATPEEWDALLIERNRLREEVEYLREWLRAFADRIDRDRHEPDKLLIEVTSMRAIVDRSELRDSDPTDPESQGGTP